MKPLMYEQQSFLVSAPTGEQEEMFQKKMQFPFSIKYTPESRTSGVEPVTPQFSIKHWIPKQYASLLIFLQR